MLQAKQPAPAFRSPNQHGTTVSLADFAGKQHLVLYFYPKDDTPGCTIEKNGVKKMGIVRFTFVIDKDGTLVEALYQVDPNGHAQAVLDVVRLLR